MKFFFITALLFVSLSALAIDPVLLPRACSVQYTVSEDSRGSFLASLTDSLASAGMVVKGRDHKQYSVSQSLSSRVGTIKYSVVVFSSDGGYTVRFYSHSKQLQSPDLLAAIVSDFTSKIKINL